MTQEKYMLYYIYIYFICMYNYNTIYILINCSNIVRSRAMLDNFYSNKI